MADLVTEQVKSASQDVADFTNKLEQFEAVHETTLNEYAGIKKKLRDAKKAQAKALAEYYVVKEHDNE